MRELLDACGLALGLIGRADPGLIEIVLRSLAVSLSAVALAGFVGACDGELTVTQIAAALADLFEVPLAELWADLEPRLRALVTDGFLNTAEERTRNNA